MRVNFRTKYQNKSNPDKIQKYLALRNSKSMKFSLRTGHAIAQFIAIYCLNQSYYPITPHISALHLKAHALISEYRRMRL